MACGLTGCGLTPSLQHSAAQDDLMESMRQATLGKTVQARQWADRAIAADPHSEAVYGPPGVPRSIRVADVFSQVGDDPSLVLYMQKAHAQFPSSDWPLVTLTQAQDRLGDIAGRQKSAQALVDILNKQMTKPGAFPSAQVLTTLAQAYFDAGDAANGEKTYKRVIDTFPRDDNLAGACNNLAYAYANANMHLPEALALVNRALSLRHSQPGDDNGYIRDTLGWVQFRMGNYKDAVSTLQGAVFDSPRQAESRYHLAMAYKALGQTDAARVEFRHAVQLSVGYAAPIKELAALSASKPLHPAG